MPADVGKTHQTKKARVIRISRRQQIVLLAFDFLFKKNGVFPSGYQVVEHTSLTENQVDKAITALMDKGLLKRNRH